MRVYLAIFRMRFMHCIQYRIVVFSNVFTGFLWGLMLVLAYTAFYRANPSASPMTLSQTVSYMWLQQILLILFSVVFSDSEIETSVESGTITYELTRPCGLYGRWITRAGAGRVAFTVLRLPILLIVLFLPEPYRLSLPPDFFHLIMFLLSVALALCVTVTLTMLMYVTLFYTVSFGGVYVVVIAVTSFLTGAVIPFPFLPAAVRSTLEVLPFAAIQNMPLRIYIGNIAGADALKGILFQAVWIVLLFAAGKRLMNSAISRVVVQGG